MAHRIEKQIREGNPEPVTGCDIKKINDAVGTITHRAGQRGHTVKLIEITVHAHFSTREVNTLAYKLVTNHRLRLKQATSESGWRH